MRKSRQEHRKKPRIVLGENNDLDGMHIAVTDFLEWMKVTNYSPLSVDHHREHLNTLITWLAERGITQPREVTKAMLERFQRNLYYYRKKNGQPLSFRSQHTRLAAVRALFKWLARRHRTDYNPASELELPRVEQHLPKNVLNASEVEQVLNLPDITAPLGMRDRAIMETFYSTGMRRGELAGLRYYDIDAELGTVVIRQGKGKKDRVVPIGERALLWIDKYMREARPQLSSGADQAALFLSSETGGPMDLHTLTDLIRRYIQKADLGKTGSCHLFRHTMATLLLEAGCDTRHIQLMLGHAKLETTQIYTQVSIRQLKEIHARLHPARAERK